MADSSVNGTRMWLAVSLFSFFFFFTSQILARPQLFIPDPIAGYAIGGNDPVAYFVDRRPRRGIRQLEYVWGGARWVFVNRGNLEAFRNSPQTYAPLFAGCGGYSLSEGFATAGNPHIFAFVDGRLVFFHSAVNRFLFMVNVSQYLEDAERHAHKTGCKPAL